MHQPSSEEKLTLLSELEVTFRENWRLVLACMAAGFVIAALSLQGATYSYPVTMQMVTAQSSNNDATSAARSSLNQLSSLAGVASITLPQTQNALNFQLFVDSLTSRDVADEIAKNPVMMHRLFQPQLPLTAPWVEPQPGLGTTVFLFVRKLLGLAPATPWQPPNGKNVQNFIADHVTVLQDPRKTYMVTITMISGDKALSIDFLNLLVKAADDRLRQKALSRARNYIAYLDDRLSTVSLAELRTSLIQTLSDQERYAMVATSNAPFAAEVFQSPWASNLPADPSPRVTYLIWIVVGAMLAMAYGLCAGDTVSRYGGGWTERQGRGSATRNMARRQEHRR